METRARITVAITLLLLTGCTAETSTKSNPLSEAIAQSNQKAVAAVAPPKSALPQNLKLNLSLDRPQDLKVKVDDSVAAGQILVEKTSIKQSLLNGRSQLILDRKQIENRKVITPQPPNAVPIARQLPPTSYAGQEATINTTDMRIEQLNRAIFLQQQQALRDPPSFAAALTAANDKVTSQQRLIDNQKRKIEAVTFLKDLPVEVSLHEQEVLHKLEAQLDILKSDVIVAAGNLEDAKLQRFEKLQLLNESLNKARTDRTVAIAGLQAAKDARAYQEYQASISAATRIEQSNTALSNYQEQLIAAEEQKREQAFQIATVNAKISEIDEKIASLSVVTSPYTGTIKKIKWLGQSDRALNVELTLALNPSTPSDGSNATPSTTIDPSGTSTTTPSATDTKR